MTKTFALLAAIQFWFPKFFGRLVPEFCGKLSFWIIFVGFNATFFPMHFLGLNGMPRRTWTYDANMGWNEGNMFATIGAYLLGVGIFTYFAVLVWSYFKGQKCGSDPWDGRTLEWSIPSPRRSITSPLSRPSTPATPSGTRSTTRKKSPRNAPTWPRRAAQVAPSVSGASQTVLPACHAPSSAAERSGSFVMAAGE